MNRSPLQRSLDKALSHLQLATSAVYQTYRTANEFWPARDRLRFNVHPDVLAAGVDKLPAPVGVRNTHTLVSSLTKQGTHRPVLDLDGVGAALVPSTTEGNFHLYLDGIELTWRQYRRFLKACAAAGLITPGYLQHSLRREQTLVRRPGLRKTWRELEKASAYEVSDSPAVIPF